MAIHDSILDTIGRTPVVKLHRIAPAHVELYAKVEAFNPAGSVKDRLALAIILDAEARGALKPGDTIVEATSGNTGVALAAVAAARGYKFVAVMTETFSIERRKLIRAYGAKVILTPAAERGTGMVRKAEELASKHGWFLASQFANPANPAYHRQTTAAEILRDFAGRRLDHFVSGWGTGGTLTGVGEVLRVARPEVKIVAAEPANASLLGGSEWKPPRAARPEDRRARRCAGLPHHRGLQDLRQRQALCAERRRRRGRGRNGRGCRPDGWRRGQGRRSGKALHPR